MDHTTDDGRSYADQINAPLSPATVEALNRELASDNPARYRRRATDDDGPGWDAYAKDMAYLGDGMAYTPDTADYAEMARVEQEETAATGHEQMWLIWSTKHNLWWGPNQRNYVTFREQAGRYTTAEAVEIIKDSLTGWNPSGGGIPWSMLIPADT